MGCDLLLLQILIGCPAVLGVDEVVMAVEGSDRKVLVVYKRWETCQMQGEMWEKT